MILNVNDTIEEYFSFSQNEVNQFIEITGDDNPIHHDLDFASKTLFKKPIIHGFLAASVFSKILGIKMPGYGTIYLKQEMNFKSPMYTDVQYKCIVQITEIKGKKYTLSTHVINEEENLIMIDGYAVVLFDSKSE